MNENADQNFWNKKLAAEGMPEDLKPTKVPIPASSKEVLIALIPDIEGFLEEFKTLSPEIQDGIIVDIKSKRKMGIPSREILDRLAILIAKSQELDKMTVANSDRDYKPKPSREKLEQKEIDDAVNRVVNTFIEKAERIRHGDNFKPQGVDKYKN